MDGNITFLSNITMKLLDHHTAVYNETTHVKILAKSFLMYKIGKCDLLDQSAAIRFLNYDFILKKINTTNITCHFSSKLVN